MSMQSEVRAELLSFDQIEKYIAESPIVYVPVGALEFHGAHLPIGLDGLTAHGVCVAAAQITGGIVLPVMYQGTGGEHSNYPWTIMMPDHFSIEKNLVATLERLQTLGVRSCVILSGHFANEQREFLSNLNRKWNSITSNSMQLETASMADHESAIVPADHAGYFESMMLAAIHPELVNLDKLPDPESHPSVDPDDNLFGQHRHSESHALWGIFGTDPRGKSLQKAPDLLNEFATWLANLAKLK
ncbi:MAG: creatininase family protein [Micrococcales bacterium]